LSSPGRIRADRLLLLVAALGCSSGCGSGKSKFDGADIRVQAVSYAPLDASGTYLYFTVSNDATGCLDLSPGATFTLDGVALTPTSMCAAGAGPFAEDRSFNFVVQDGGDRAQMDVADLSPGLHATLNAPADGNVAPGGDLAVGVPPALQDETAVAGDFNYTDSDDPSFMGDHTIPAGATPDTVHLPAPVHPGHFTFWVQMQPAEPTLSGPPGSVLSCSGARGCFATGAPILGPLAIDVVP
jgi:hypothetical protein